MRKRERETKAEIVGRIMDLEKLFNRITPKWYRCKLLNCIKSVYVNSLACARVKERWVWSFKTESGVR